VEAAYDLNWPLRARPGTAAAAAAGSLARSDTPALHVQAAKLAEDGSGDLILRLVELYGSRGTANLELPFAPTDAAFCDLLERPAAPASVREGGVQVAFAPDQLLTLRLRR
jgi:alpha-mannosidase